MEKEFQRNIQKMRNEKLGLTFPKTELVLDTILKCWKEKVLNAPKKVVDYTIDIILTNVNGLNCFGKLIEMYERWGDTYLIDFNKSCFISQEIDSNGHIVNNEIIPFKTCDDLKLINNISISILGLFSLCQKNNCHVKIYSCEEGNHETCIEINVMKQFEKNQSIKDYLNMKN